MIDRIDHLVLTVASLERTCAFYSRVLGFERHDVPGRPTALHGGSCKINVHEFGHEFEPHAARPTAGSADFCLVTSEPLDHWLGRLHGLGVPVEQGPIARTGTAGAMTSIYLRDPDHNLVEISRYDR